MLASLGLSSCVTVYQPLVSLQRPAVVDPRLPNFQGLRLGLRCVPGDDLDPSDSEALCSKVGVLFRNQGAQVLGPTSDPASPAPELRVDLSTRKLHEENSTLLWVLSAMSFTLLPAVTEYSVAQDVKIRDANGFLLGSDSLQARFVRYFGVGVWGINWVLDVLVREDDEELTGNTASRDFSNDYYAQLSQLVFDARVRSTVLRGFPTLPPRGGD